MYKRQALEPLCGVDDGLHGYCGCSTCTTVTVQRKRAIVLACSSYSVVFVTICIGTVAQNEKVGTGAYPLGVKQMNTGVCDRLHWHRGCSNECMFATKKEGELGSP